MNYKEITPEFTTTFFDLVENARDVVITAHESPDEDSLASVFSMFEILSVKYPQKKIRIIYSGDSVDRLKMFKNYDAIKFVLDMSEFLDDVDLLIMMDGSQYSRFGKNTDKMKNVISTICIDHHASPIDSFTLSLVSPKYSSCTELIYLIFCTNTDITKELAEIFMLGILGDTGNFTFIKPHQTDTLLTAKKLLDIGEIEIQEFQSRYRAIPKRTFDIIQELIKNTAYGSSRDWPDFQYTYLSRSLKDEHGYSDMEISQASHIYMSSYLRTIENHPWGFIVTPKSNGDCSLSGRSLPHSVSVREMFERMKLGGGHDRAAGGSFKKVKTDTVPEECVQVVLGWIKGNSPVLV